MSHAAFTLADEYVGTVQPVDVDGEPQGDPIPKYGGGVLAIPPFSESFDVAAKLAAGDGTIVVSAGNVALVEMLRQYPALREVPVPSGWAASDDLDDLSRAQLQDIAGELEIARNGTKPDLIARITEERARRAAANPVVEATITTSGEQDA